MAIAGCPQLRLTASIGIGMYPQDATQGETLLQCADHAMYQVKEQGGNAFRHSGVGTGPPKSRARSRCSAN